MFQQTKNLGRLRVARQEKQVLPFSTDWSFPFWPNDEQPRSSVVTKKTPAKVTALSIGTTNTGRTIFNSRNLMHSQRYMVHNVPL